MEAELMDSRIMKNYLQNLSLVEMSIYKMNLALIRLNQKELDQRKYITNFKASVSAEDMTAGNVVLQAIERIFIGFFKGGLYFIMANIVLVIGAYILAIIVSIVDTIRGAESKLMDIVWYGVEHPIRVVSIPSKILFDILKKADLFKAHPILMGILGWAIIGAIVGLIITLIKYPKRFSNSSKAKKQYKQEQNAYQTNRINAKNYNLALHQEIATEKNKIKTRLSQGEALRAKLYNEDILNVEFRNIQAVTTMFGYYYYKEVSNWHECVSMYRMEKHSRKIEEGLQQISGKLDGVLSILNDISSSLSRVQNTQEALLRSALHNEQSNMQLLNQCEKIAYNTEVGIFMQGFQTLQLSAIENRMN